MLIFGHTGITLAAAWSLEKAILSRRVNNISGLVDYRLVLLGSMLPDIVDKPLGGLLLRETLGNGRIYCHTLLFLLLLSGAGVFLWFARRKSWLLILAGGTFFHHVLDSMWLWPQTFLWPIYGWSFAKGDPAGWFRRWLESLLTKPHVFIPELIGAAILAYFICVLIVRKNLREFITTGKLIRVSPEKAGQKR